MRNRRKLKSTTVAAAIAVALLVTAAQAPAASVSKSQREAVIFVADLKEGSAIEGDFFDFVNFAAGPATKTAIDLFYNRVRLVTGKDATRSNLKRALKTSARKSGIRAVDLFFSVHGVTKTMLINGSRVEATAVEADIKGHLTTAQRRKLRMVYSTACFGRTHGKSWRDAGFRATSGSEAVYADSATSHPAFLSSWVAGATFRNAVGNANAVRPPSDAAAREFLRGINQDSIADQVNSQRFIRGAGNQVRIDNMPPSG